MLFCWLTGMAEAMPSGQRRAGLGLDSRGRLSPRGSGRREEMAGGKQGFAEVAGDDLVRLAHGGEVDAGIPAEEYIDVCRYLSQLRGGEDSRFLGAEARSE